MSIISEIIAVSNTMPKKAIAFRVLKLMEGAGEIAEVINKGKGRQEFIDECADAMIVIVDMVNQVCNDTYLPEETLQEAVTRKLERWVTKYGEKEE